MADWNGWSYAESESEELSPEEKARRDKALKERQEKTKAALQARASRYQRQRNHAQMNPTDPVSPEEQAFRDDLSRRSKEQSERHKKENSGPDFSRL